MISRPTCDLCDRPLPDQAYVCERCTDREAESLRIIASLAGEVEAAVAKLVGHGLAVGGGGGHGHPLPVDLVAAEKAATVGNTVSTWARHVSLTRGVEVPRTRPSLEGPSCRTNTCRHLSCAEIRSPRREVGVALAARFLLGQLGWLRHRQEAAEALGDLHQAALQLQRVLGGRPPRWYAGQCWEPRDDGERCAAELYASPGASTVRCPECDTMHDAKDRREWLLREAEDQLLHAELMARALTGLGVEDLTPARVRGMARHGRLATKGTDAAGRPLYRVGDVRDVVAEQARAEAERAAKRDDKARRKAERAEGKGAAA